MSQRNPYDPGDQGGNIQQRTLLLFVVMGAVLFLLPYFLKSGRPQQPVKNAKTEKPAKPAQEATSQVSSPPSPNAAPTNDDEAVTPQSVSAHDEQHFAIDTPVYHVVFSNRGGVVTSWTLKKYPNAAGKPLELVNDAAASKTGYPFDYYFRGQKPSQDLNQKLFLATRSPDGLGVSFDYAEGGTVAHKAFTFQSDGYLTEVASEVRVNGAEIPHLLEWRGGFGDFAVQNASGVQRAIRYNLSDSKLANDSTKAAKDGPTNRDGQFSFAGLEDQYFAAVFLPRSQTNLETTLFNDRVPTQFDKSEQAFIGSAVGGPGENRFELFVGPKDLALLKKVNPKLEQIVDFGFWWFLAKPLFLVLRFMNQAYIHNYGWSIVLITIIINFLLFPLRLTNMKSMRKMQALQPKIQAINERYKGMSMRDPRMQQKNQETMALYKEHGANPAGGCIPLLIQMPFLFAFYKVLAVSIEMRNASWLWVGDLSQPEHLPIRILPIVMIATSFLMQRMTPTTGVDPQQQKMMMFMPLVMGFFFYNQSAGLVLYWLTSNVMGIAQQVFFNKTMLPAAPAPVAKNAPARLAPKKAARR